MHFKLYWHSYEGGFVAHLRRIVHEAQILGILIFGLRGLPSSWWLLNGLR